MNTEEMLSQRENINKAFKSLIKSGRPDIRDDNNNDMVKELYVDLFESNHIYILVLFLVIKGMHNIMTFIRRKPVYY